MAVTAKPIPSDTAASDLIKQVREVVQDLVDQLNERGQIYISSDGHIPTGINTNDLVVVSTKGKLAILLRRRTGFDRLTSEHIGGLTANGTNFKGTTTSGAAPSTTEFSLNGDWGFHNRTGGSPNFYLAYNLGGVIKSVVL